MKVQKGQVRTGGGVEEGSGKGSGNLYIIRCEGRIEREKKVREDISYV